MRVPAEQIRQQLVSVLRAWGMSDAHADTTAEMMVETDLRGVDSHGISMLPDLRPRVPRRPAQHAPGSSRPCAKGRPPRSIDADASLGHPVSVHAMNLAVDKCRELGVAVVSVFNSHHFGAAGCYSRIAADRGVIGMVTSATRGVTMVPTFGAEPVMGTNPLAFAAPARPQPAVPARHGDDDGRRRQGQGLQAEPQAAAGGLGRRRRRPAGHRRDDGVQLRLRASRTAASRRSAARASWAATRATGSR